MKLADQEVDPFWHAYAQAIAHGSHGEADAALRQVIDTYADTSAFQIAQVYALKNDLGTMFAWLDPAVATRCGNDLAALRRLRQGYSAYTRFAELYR